MSSLLSRIRSTTCALLLALALLLVLGASAEAAEPIFTKPAEHAEFAGRAQEGIAPIEVTGTTLATLKVNSATPLPEGLELKPVEAETEWVISGTPKGAQPKTAITLEATSESKTATLTIELTVHPALARIEAPSELTATLGEPIEAVTIKGTDLSTLKTTEPLPEGLKLEPGAEPETEAKITGTPLVPVKAKVVTLEAENAEGEPTTAEISVTVAEAAPTIAKPADQSSTAGKAIGALVIEGTNLHELEAAELPAGLALHEESETRWTISGTPTTAKAATVVTLTARNNEHLAGAPVTFSWIVGAAEVPAKPAETTPAPTPTPTIPSAGRLGTVPIQKQGQQLFATFLCEVASCKVTITATIKAGKSTFKVRSNVITILQGKKPRIPLRIKKKQRELIAAALKKHKKVTAAISASIESSVGLQVTKALTVTVKR